MALPYDPRSNSILHSDLVSGLTYRAAKRAMADQFREASVAFADEDALDLVLGLTGLTLTDYTLRGSEIVPTERLDALRLAAERRLAGEPIDRILGWRDFYGRRFNVDDVLSPRGDTEVLLLAALEAVRDIETPHVLDLGTGSGALAISVLCERADATALATDRDAQALKTTAKNAASLSVTDRLELIQSDWFNTLPPLQFDAVLSNPPYITSEAMTQLDPEVAEHDPKTALHGGEDGLDPYRIIIPGARDYLKPGGWLGVEIGYDQGQAVQSIFQDIGFLSVRIMPDPAGHDRVVCGRLT